MTAVPPPGTVPALLRSRLLSIRAYDANHLMIEADVVEGRELESCLTRIFERTCVRYAHIHFARPGCFACRVDRAALDDGAGDATQAAPPAAATLKGNGSGDQQVPT